MYAGNKGPEQTARMRAICSGPSLPTNVIRTFSYAVCRKSTHISGLNWQFSSFVSRTSVVIDVFNIIIARIANTRAINKL